MADRDRRNQDDNDDKAPTARPLTPGQREAHRRDTAEQARDAQLDAQRERETSARAQREEAERRQAAIGLATPEPGPQDRPALASMTLSEFYDALDTLAAGSAADLDTVVTRVRDAIRAQAPDYQDLACRLVMAPMLTFGLRKEHA